MAEPDRGRVLGAGRVRLVAIILVSLVSAPLAFAVLGRMAVGEPRPVGSTCAFEADPGSGRSHWGRVEHRGWLIPHEACVHPPYRDNEEWLGADPYLGAMAAPVVTFVMLLLATEVVLTVGVVRTRGRPAEDAGA